MKQTKMFECTLCKKIRAYEQLDSLFKDGAPLCKICAADIKGSFHWCVDGKAVKYDEFKKRTEKEE